MILHPSVLALEVASLATAGLVVYAARWGLVILQGWDLASGSSRQLALERRTFLVSTMLGYALAFELLSAFLFAYTADALAPLLHGAMCAAGTLQASALGYPVLLLKVANVVVAVVSFVSPYVYELPTHHCPFCLLQREYRFVGYPLYAALLGGGVAGIAAGVVAPFRKIPSLAETLPPFQRRLATASAVLLAGLVALVVLLVATSHLRA